MKHLSYWTVDKGLPRPVGNLSKSDKALAGSSCAGMLLALALFTASGAMAQSLPAFPPGAEQREAQLMKRVGPQTRAWIAQEARREAAQPELSEQMAVASVRANAAELGNLGDGDIMALAFIVMMEASRTAHEDLKASMEGVKSVNEAKARARQNQMKVRSDAATSQHAIQASGNSGAVVRKPMPVTSRADIAARPLPKVQLDGQVDKAKSDPDSLSELNDTESLRLQMAMDRVSKSMSTLSNMLKKISDTDASIAKNMKLQSQFGQDNAAGIKKGIQRVETVSMASNSSVRIDMSCVNDRMYCWSPTEDTFLVTSSSVSGRCWETIAATEAATWGQHRLRRNKVKLHLE